MPRPIQDNLHNKLNSKICLNELRVLHSYCNCVEIPIEFQFCRNLHMMNLCGLQIASSHSNGLPCHCKQVSLWTQAYIPKEQGTLCFSWYFHFVCHRLLLQWCNRLIKQRPEWSDHALTFYLFIHHHLNSIYEEIMQ